MGHQYFRIYYIKLMFFGIKKSEKIPSRDSQFMGIRKSVNNKKIILTWNLTLCNCEWKAHIFFVHRSMHWKPVHLWTQVHQTQRMEDFFHKEDHSPFFHFKTSFPKKYLPLYCMNFMPWGLLLTSIYAKRDGNRHLL